MRKIYFFILAMMITVNAFGSEIQTKTFSFEGRKIVIHPYDLPYGEGPHPAVLVVPGLLSSGQDALRELSNLLRMFKNEKYACFAVDCSTNLYTSGQQLPMPIREVKAALRFLRASYGEDGWIDTTFIAVVGFNLGGYVASMMGVTRNIDSYTIGSETWDFESSDFAAYSSSVDAVIDIAGFAEWKDADGCVSSSYDSDASILGCSYANCPDKWELANLNAYVTPDAAPTLIIHGETDPVIPICRNEKFFATLQAAGVDCEFHTHAGGHIFSSLSSDLREKAVDFIKRIRAAKQAQAIESPSLQGRSGEAFKFIQDGQLLILRGDKTFNAIGTQVR